MRFEEGVSVFLRVGSYQGKSGVVVKVTTKRITVSLLNVGDKGMKQNNAFPCAEPPIYCLYPNK